MCECTVVLIGRPGLVTLHARDYEDVHDSELRPAYLEINLSAGPVACLEFEKTQLLQYGLRDCIEALRLHAIDCFGNRTSCAPFEVITWHAARGLHSGQHCSDLKEHKMLDKLTCSRRHVLLDINWW